MFLCFEDPPPISRHNSPQSPSVPGGEFREELKRLRDHPEKWARLTLLPFPHNRASSYVRRIKAGLYEGIKPREFEACVRRGHVYARFIN